MIAPEGMSDISIAEHNARVEKLKPKLEARISGRQHAEDWLVFATEINDSADPYFTNGFWSAVRNEADKHLPPREPQKPEIVPMSDAEAAEFGKRLILFGRHVNECVKDVDPDYLLWLADSPDDFKKDLKRFLANRDVIRLTQGDSE